MCKMWLIFVMRTCLWTIKEALLTCTHQSSWRRKKDVSLDTPLLWADVYTTSLQRRCNLMTLHRRWGGIVYTSCAHWKSAVNTHELLIHNMYTYKVMKKYIKITAERFFKLTKIIELTNAWCKYKKGCLLSIRRGYKLLCLIALIL